MKAMDLIDYREKYGRQSLTELAARAGIEPSYLAQLMGGFRRITLDRAQRFVSLDPRLDVIALQLMADRVRDIKKRRERRAAAQKSNGKKKSSRKRTSASA